MTANYQIVVRGINDIHFKENMSEFTIYFGGTPQSIPINTADYIGLYCEGGECKLELIGIVDSISEDRTCWTLSAIIKLLNPITVTHGIRKHEWYDFSYLSNVDIQRILKVKEALQYKT